MTKFSSEKYEQFLEDSNTMSISELAEKYDISVSYVKNLKNGKLPKGIKGSEKPEHEEPEKPVIKKSLKNRNLKNRKSQRTKNLQNQSMKNLKNQNINVVHVAVNSMRNQNAVLIVV